MTVEEIEKLNRHLEERVDNLITEHEKETGMVCRIEIVFIEHETMAGVLISRKICVKSIVE